jgi:hypothetical protein
VFLQEVAAFRREMKDSFLLFREESDTSQGSEESISESGIQGKFVGYLSCRLRTPFKGVDDAEPHARVKDLAPPSSEDQVRDPGLRISRHCFSPFKRSLALGG